jgi:hypothetical protein
MSDYVAVSCAQYDRYEAAIMRRRRLRPVWAESHMLCYHCVRPLDLQTRAGEQFLICRTLDGVLKSIRFDYIRRAKFS